jgi:ABC-2 type transport system permease protein
VDYPYTPGFRGHTILVQSASSAVVLTPWQIMTTHSSTLRFTRALLAANLKSTVLLRGAFVMQVAFMALNNLTFFVFWWALMRRVPVLRGWRLGDVQVLFGIVAAGFGLAVTFAGGVRHLGRFIDEGELDTLLTQPRPVLLYGLGLRSQASGVGDVLSGMAFIACSGEYSWRALPLIAFAVVASALVIIACGIVFFSLAFWLGRVETLTRQLWDLLITFSLYPEPLFGGMLRLMLFTVLPAGFVGYVPAHLVRSPSSELVLLMTIAIASYLSIAIVVFERGLRRYTSGSRFGTFG